MSVLKSAEFANPLARQWHNGDKRPACSGYGSGVSGSFGTSKQVERHLLQAGGDQPGSCYPCVKVQKGTRDTLDLVSITWPEASCYHIHDSHCCDLAVGSGPGYFTTKTYGAGGVLGGNSGVSGGIIGGDQVEGGDTTGCNSGLNCYGRKLQEDSGWCLFSSYGQRQHGN